MGTLDQIEGSAGPRSKGSAIAPFWADAIDRSRIGEADDDDHDDRGDEAEDDQARDCSFLAFSHATFLSSWPRISRHNVLVFFTRPLTVSTSGSAGVGRRELRFLTCEMTYRVDHDDSWHSSSPL